MHDFLEVMAIAAGILGALIVAVISIVMGIAAGPSRWECEQLAQGMKVQTEYEFWYQCIVIMPDGSRIPKSIWEKQMSQDYKVRVNPK